jgi:hypothetical protein
MIDCPYSGSTAVLVAPAPQAVTEMGVAAFTVSVAAAKIDKEKTEQRIRWNVFMRCVLSLRDNLSPGLFARPLALTTFF